MKWGPGIYLGVARDVPRGHVVLTEDGHLWCSCSVREVDESPEVFAKGKGPALRPIRTVVDVILLAEDVTEAAAQAVLDDEWRFRSLPSNTHEVNDVEDVLFLIWGSRESIWQVVKEAGDEGEIHLPTWHSRHSGGSADEELARVTKVERNVNEDRYIFWFREQLGENEAGERTFRERITYVQGTENVQQHIVPLAEVGDRGLDMARRQPQLEMTRRVKRVLKSDLRSAPPTADPSAKAAWRRQAEEELAMALLAGRGDLGGAAADEDNQNAEECRIEQFRQ